MACVVGSQDREHQDTDADHECRVEQHQRGAGDEQRGGVAAVIGADDARRYEAAYAICQVARKEKDPNDSGGPTHAGVRANDWRGGRVVGGGYRVHGAKWPWSVIQSANATSCVGSGWCPGAASDAMTTTTSHTTPDTRLIASSGAAEEDLTGFVRAWWSGQHRPLMPLSGRPHMPMSGSSAEPTAPSGRPGGRRRLRDHATGSRGPREPRSTS